MPAAKAHSRQLWTFQEMKLVSEAAARLHVQDPSLKKGEAFARAKQALKGKVSERRLTATHLSPSQRLGKLFDAEVARLKTAAGHLSEPPAPVVSDSLRKVVAKIVADPLQDLNGADSLETPQQAPAQQPSQSVHYGPMDALVDAVADACKVFLTQITGDIVERVVEAIQARTMGIKEAPTLPPKDLHPVDLSGVPRKPKVLVVGLKERHAPIMADRMKGRLDLRFWKDGNDAQLASAVRGMDAVVVAVDWVPHKVTEITSIHHPRAHLVKGSNTSIHQFLERMVREDGLPGH